MIEKMLERQVREQCACCLPCGFVRCGQAGCSVASFADVGVAQELFQASNFDGAFDETTGVDLIGLRCGHVDLGKIAKSFHVGSWKAASRKTKRGLHCRGE